MTPDRPWKGQFSTKELSQSALEFCILDHDRFARFLRDQGTSCEIGPVGSQYLEEMKEKSEKVGAIGLKACDQLVGIISYGISEFKTHPGHFADKLDVVVVRDGVRNVGVGALLMAYLFDFLAKKLGSNLRQVTTIAFHPAVARYVVSRFGFTEPPKFTKVPLCSLALDDEDTLKKFADSARREIKSRTYKLNQTCIDCRKEKCEPWCVDSDEE